MLGLWGGVRHWDFCIDGTLDGHHEIFTAHVHLSLIHYLCSRWEFGELNTQLFTKSLLVCFAEVWELSDLSVYSFQLKLYLNRKMISINSPLIGLHITENQNVFRVIR
jgi:hypothetical protein